MPDAPDTPSAPPPRPRRRRRWIALGCILILCVWFGHFAYLRITLRPTPRPEYWEEKLAALDPPPPGAALTDQTLRLISSPPWMSDPAIAALGIRFHAGQLLRDRWKTPRTDTAAASRAFASRISDDARREILGALEVGWPEPVSLDPTTFGGMTYHRSLATWLLVHARWAREETADPTVAAEDWLGVLRVARQLRRQQTTLPLMIEGRIMSETAREMMLAAREGVVPSKTRDLAERIEQVVGPPRTPRQLFEGDRLAALCQMEFMFVRQGGQWMDVSETIRLNGPAFGMGTIPTSSRLWNLTSPIFHDLPEATRGLDRYWTELDKCVDLRACQDVQNKLETDREIDVGALDGYFHDTTGGSYPTTVRVIANHYAAMCSLDAAVTMLALEAHHERHDEYPATLSELIPDYLPRLPVDYADRQSLRYHRSGIDYDLYSIGTDGKDDGGIDRTGGRPSFRENTGDVVFSAIEREEMDR